MVDLPLQEQPEMPTMKAFLSVGIIRKCYHLPFRTVRSGLGAASVVINCNK